jgi:anti-sigma factor RsiW
MRLTTQALRQAPVAVVALGLAAVLTACGSGAGGYNTGGGGSGSHLSVSVTTPRPNATVTVPFTVKLHSSVPIGATDTGKHHVHIWFDDNKNDYLVVESTTTEITKLSAGHHTMHVSLRNADHSPAGADAEVPIMVSGSSGASPSGSADTTPPGNPYNY